MNITVNPSKKNVVDKALAFGDGVLKRHQFIAMLDIHGANGSIVAGINQLPITVEQRKIYKAAYQEAPEFHRKEPVIEAIRGILGASAEDFDAWWLLAKNY